MGTEQAAGELPEALVALLGPYLARQRWYAGEKAPAAVEVTASERLGGTPSGDLLWAVVRTRGDEHEDDYQLVVGARSDGGSPESLGGHEEAVIGTVGGRRYYDATVDPEMSMVLLEAASGGAEKAQWARPLTGEQSNTSVIYDDRLILKVFRRLSMGVNPDVEVTSALAAKGFAHVAKPLVRWQRDGRDLAFGQQFLAGGTDGWALALTSLRDFYSSSATGDECLPALSGGDFAAEAGRLGQMTAEMHLAMAEAYPGPADLSSSWPSFVERLQADLHGLGPRLEDDGKALLTRLGAVRHPGPGVRAHGDYHLGQVMRTDAGWYVLDFEGEPNRPLEERLRPTSVMKDVAGMIRSLQYASRFALYERREEPAPELEERATAWEERNAAAFLGGYYGTEGIERLLPRDAADRDAVRLAFELEKAIYELAYEEAFRPEWAHIPESALNRLLTLPVEVLLSRAEEPSEALRQV